MATNSFAFLFFIHCAVSSHVYTNCNGLEDGYYDIQVRKGSHINVRCSNEYMIIDLQHDNEWYGLLSSYKNYHKYIIGPDLNDHVNWDTFLPNLDMTHYLVSPDCINCEPDLYLNKDLFQDSSSYYMNQISNGCFHKNRGLPACDMDQITYECKICEWEVGTVTSRTYNAYTDYLDDENTGICAFTIKPNDFTVATEFKECFNYEYTAFKPSLGSNGQYCQCIKNDDINVVIEMDIKVKEEELEIRKAIKTPETNTVYLHQSDFEHGTYRIIEGGTYIIMEDIEFNFNANINEPNSQGAYMPQLHQADKYPGAGQTSGPYFMGFFSGITIETADGVVLDLNGYTLQMSSGLFFQQGFFSIIELGSQPFLPMHGPGNFGAIPKWGENIIIKNGIIGRSSHHGIHGNNNQNIVIQNINVQYFVTHGIQLNGFDTITIRDVDIGPSNNMVKLNGNYIQMRALLNNMRLLYKKDNIHETFSFWGREEDSLTFEELIEDRLIPVMNEAFKAAVYDDYEIEDPDIKETVDSVFNNHGSNQIPYGAVVYGLFLNYPASGIFGWHVSDESSSNAIIENVNVHDLYHHSEEMVGLIIDKHVVSHGLNGPLSAVTLIGEELISEISAATLESMESDDLDDNAVTIDADYIGDLVTDVHFAYYKFASSDWNYWPGTPYYGENSELVNWALGDRLYHKLSSTEVSCDSDRMQHPLKGIIGIKITGVQNVKVVGKYLKISNLHDSSDLGSKLCGDYTKASFGQQLPYSTGFSGNMVHAFDVSFSDIEFDLAEGIFINNVISDTGLSYAMSFWFETKILFNSNVAQLNIRNIVAGYRYLDNDIDDNDIIFESPNRLPKVCAIRKHDNDDYTCDITFKDESILHQSCVYGIVGCEDDYDSAKTHIGTVDNNDDKCQQIKNLFPLNKHKSIHKLNKEAIVIGPDLLQTYNSMRYYFYSGLIMIITLSITFGAYYSCYKEISIKKKQKKINPNAYGTF